MNLTIKDWNLLQSYIGEGPIHKAEVVFFGNEFGLANNDIENYLNFIKRFIKEKRYIPLGNNLNEGFVLFGRDTSPFNSTFVRFCSQFMLAHKHDDPRFLGNISQKGISFVNDYIVNELHLINSSVINLRPLPRPSESHWIYDNINKNSYLNSYNFTTKSHEFHKSVKLRILNLFKGFLKAPSPLIIGTGNKWNKLALFEKMLPKSNFKEITLSTDKKIIVDQKQKILLCDYFDQRVLGIKSLQEIFNFVREENILKKS